MAQQLYAQGAEPALLVLFDTSAPGSVQRVRDYREIAWILAKTSRPRAFLILCEKSP